MFNWNEQERVHRSRIYEIWVVERALIWSFITASNKTK